MIEKDHAPIDPYKKPDFFMPASMLSGVSSASQYQKNGIGIHVLDERLIYPKYGVWSPTSQEFLSLFDLYFRSLRNT